MTKAQALYQFFSSFGVTAYEENSVYSLENPPAFPYITYQVKTDSFGEYDTAISFSTWHRSPSWTDSNALIDAIAAAIGRDGHVIRYVDNGYMLIRRGSPFSQAMGDPVDDMIKRQYCNVSVRYYTNH